METLSQHRNRPATRRRRDSSERHQPWSRFRDGVTFGLAGHAVATAYATVHWGPEVMIGLWWLALGLAQAQYMVPLAVILAATARIEALLGLLFVAGVTVLPLVMICGTGGFRIMPFF